MKEWLSLIADVIGILGAIFALLAWLQSRQLKQAIEQETRRQNQKIQVVLQHGANKIELPIELRRAEITRAEILGRIGMLPMKKQGERFSIAYLHKPEFQKQISQVVEGSGEGIITISCTEKELAQFDL
ncbi:MAG: hypothetical protein H6659_06530 [Ardenticatenaceae bacterium]|nr:hypothetical protein [Ardenticatenaceae bacterium]